MKKQNLKKIITMGLIATSLIVVAPIRANAEWKQDNTGWWYTEGSSYATGWRQIGSDWYYFDSNGYMKTGWLNDNGKYYYLNSDGRMAQGSMVIDGEKFYFNLDGTWNKSVPNIKIISSNQLEYRGTLYDYQKDNYKHSDEEEIEFWGVVRDKDPFLNYKYYAMPAGTNDRGFTIYIKNGEVLLGNVQADNGKWYYIEEWNGLKYGWVNDYGMLKYYDWKDGHQIYGNNVNINGRTYTMSRNGLDANFWTETDGIQKGYEYDMIVEKVSYYNDLIAGGYQELK